MAANTQLNVGTAGDFVRDIDLGTNVKAQVVLTADPALVSTVRANYTAAQSNTAIASVGAGSRIAVTSVHVALANSTSVDVSVVIGFGASTTPSTTGVVFAHPGLAAAWPDGYGSGSGILGVGADGEDVRITCSAPTSGSLDVIVGYMTLPTAGV